MVWLSILHGMCVPKVHAGGYWRLPYNLGRPTFAKEKIVRIEIVRSKLNKELNWI